MNIGTKIESLIKGFWNNTQAVSPVVASLVLVVVAITGAAGVGMIQGTLASDVSDEASAGNLNMASSTELLIAGSTTVQPVSELLAEAYMDEYQGIRVTVQGGGSGAGVSSAGLGIVDLGAASRNVKDSEMEKYPSIQTYKIGGSAVVVIANNITGNITKDELVSVYSDTDGKVNLTESGGVITVNDTTGTEFTVYQRAESSGTEDTFDGYLDTITCDDDSGAEGKTGNAGVLSAVEDTTDSIGFVDFGFADGNAKVNILGVDSYHEITKDNLEKELSGAADKYPDKLARPLNYLTNGEPSAIENSFIGFARSPAAKAYFEECGFFPLLDIA